MAATTTRARLLALLVLLACAPVACDEGARATDGAPARAFWVAPDGDDDHPGDRERPWRTLAHALERLRPGDTLHLREGTWFESDLVLDRSGRPGAPITIRNHPGERPVVDGGFRAFRQPGNADWEVVDAERQLYRSVASFPGADRVYGHLGPDDGGWRLVPYEELGPLAADTEDYTDRAPYYYIGPGVHWSVADGRIYYRSRRSRHQTAPEHAVPANDDPRETAMVLFPRGRVLDVRAAHVVIEGLALRHRSTPVHVDEEAHHVTLRDCDVLGGRYHVVVRDGAHDLVFDRVTIADRFPPWVAWTDVKRPSPGRPGHLLQGAGILLSDRVDGVEIGHCTLTGLFDAIGAGQQPSNLHVHHNLFEARDDVLQLGTAAWNVEFAHNRVLAAQSGGPSWNDSGSPPPGRLGTVWIHHNVIDTSVPRRYGRADPRGLLDDKYRGPAGDGLAPGRTFGRHSIDDDSGPAPWKIYHNTCFVADDPNNGGTGHSYRLQVFDPDVPHEVVNNVFVQRADQWLVRHGRTDDGSMIMDGNLYWAPARRPGTALFEDVGITGRPRDWDSLADFVGSAAWQATRGHYPPGWESAGVEADPRLDDEHRPDPGGPAASGAVDLAGRGWPGLNGERFRGALAPRESP